MKRFTLAAAVLFAVYCQESRADYIAAIAPAPSPIATFTSVTLTPAGLAVANDDTTTASPNVASFGITFSQFGTAVVEAFTLQLAGAPPALGAVEYLFTVTVTNATSHPLGPLDIEILPGSGIFPSVAAFFDTPAQPNPTPVNGIGGSGPQWQPGDSTPTRLWFGGVNGGGGDIPVGGSQVFTFSVDVPISAIPIGSFRLAFTANPEPGTIALAGLALGAGGFYVRRRRLNKSAKKPVA